MKIILLLTFFISISFFISGMSYFSPDPYELNIENGFEGKGTIRIYDIRSDGETDEEFAEDKNTLFDYIYKSEQFLTDMKSEGKDITSRRLYVKDSLLDGEVKLNFNDVKDIETIAFEDGFYYLTMEPDDSIYSTNGEIINNDEYKRIVWDKSVKTLLFEIVATDYDDNIYKELAPYYKEEN